MAGKTILLVDDEPDIVASLRAALERAGYRIVTAEDGNMALALAERESPALAIVDMMIPRKSGLAVLQTLKQRPGGPRVIMVTANESARHQEYARRLGVDDYFVKPVAMDQLLASVRRLCPAADGSHD
jgi:two-component system alkaline phosphatase synthesis response regulator PhoP